MVETPLFFFGTLLHRPLLDAVIGHSAHLEMHAARLPGYSVHAVKEGPFPGIIAQADSFADGVMVTGATARDLERLAYYESAFEYTLQKCVLDNGQVAQVYVPVSDVWTLQGTWDVESWARDWGEISVLSAREVMSYLGSRPAHEVGAMFAMIRARAWSHINARTSKHGALTLDGQVSITHHSRPYAKYFALDEYNLSHDRFDGTQSNEVMRAVFRAPDAALVLPYDPVRDCVLLVEQIRMGPLARGDRTLWQLEPIAGRLDPGEGPKAAARREALEEAGLSLGEMFDVAEAYCSPGNSSEFYYIYVAIADLAGDVTGIGGLESENEDIRSHIIGFETLMQMCDAQQLVNAPLIMSAYWLARHRERLRAMA